MSRNLLVLIFAFGLCASAAPAEVVILPLDFVPASSSFNRLNLTVSASYDTWLGTLSDSDSKTTSVQSGSTAQLKLDYTFDEVTRAVTSVNSIEFVGGSFSLSNVTFNLTFALLFTETIVATGIGGTFDTPSPPGSISGATAATFPTAQHDVILNQGTLNMSGIGDTVTINLASDPIATTTVGTGQINTSAPSIVGSTATYNVEMILPVSFTEPVETGISGLTASVAGTGTFKAVGSFSVTPPSYPPVAVNDPASQYASYYQCDEDAFISVPAAMGVLFNDTDANGDPLTAIKTTNPANGTVELSSDGSLVYTPNPDWFGTDTFKYKAFDGELWSNEATVSLDVISVNDPPVAVDDYYETPQDTILQMAVWAGVLKNDDDVDHPRSALSASVVPGAGVSHGSLSLYSSGWFKYTPAPGYSGMDSFSYRAFDGVDYSDPATVLINVIGTTKVPGDANDDGYVNDVDAKILADHWGDAGASWAMGDFDEDGVIGPKDAAILAANWGYGPTGEADAAAVPEPGVLSLLATLLLGLAARRRR
ncbi:MAG: tandem-95 repeat protein [Pirellulaceae bacterium]|nr:tandem-95 repeat protein [Pirellulaceae bacterium]